MNTINLYQLPCDSLVWPTKESTFKYKQPYINVQYSVVPVQQRVSESLALKWKIHIPQKLPFIICSWTEVMISYFNDFKFLFNISIDISIHLTHTTSLPSHQAFWEQSGFPLSAACIGLVPTFQPLSPGPSVYQGEEISQITWASPSFTQGNSMRNTPACKIISKHGTHSVIPVTSMNILNWIHSERELLFWCCDQVF